MNTTKAIKVAIFTVIIIGFDPQTSSGDGFSSADVLDWPAKNQDSLIRTSVGMSGIIAAQIRKDVARCIDDWYFSDIEMQKQRNEEIRGVMMKNPGFHPQAVVLAVIQEACGPIR